MWWFDNIGAIINDIDGEVLGLALFFLIVIIIRFIILYVKIQSYKTKRND